MRSPRCRANAATVRLGSRTAPSPSPRATPSEEMPTRHARRNVSGVFTGRERPHGHARLPLHEGQHRGMQMYSLVFVTSHFPRQHFTSVISSPKSHRHLSRGTPSMSEQNRMAAIDVKFFSRESAILGIVYLISVSRIYTDVTSQNGERFNRQARPSSFFIV